MIHRLIVLAILLPGGCSIETAGLAAPRTRGDAATDARVRRDAGADARVRRDAGAGGGFDAGDASRDAGMEQDAGTPSCDDIFGTAPEYVPCFETPMTCAFNVRTSDASCDEICGRFGRTCVEAWDNPNSGDACGMLGVDGCAYVGRTTELCECRR